MNLVGKSKNKNNDSIDAQHRCTVLHICLTRKYLEPLARSSTILSPPSNHYDTDFTLPLLLAYLLFPAGEERNVGKQKSASVGIRHGRACTSRNRTESKSRWTRVARFVHFAPRKRNESRSTSYVFTFSYGAPSRRVVRPASVDDYIANLVHSARKKEITVTHRPRERTLRQPASMRWRNNNASTVFIVGFSSPFFRSKGIGALRRSPIYILALWQELNYGADQRCIVDEKGKRFLRDGLSERSSTRSMVRK